MTHRSVWVAALAVGTMLLLSSGGRTKRLIIPTAYFLTGVITLSLLLGVGDSFLATLRESAQSTGTLSGRLYDWTYLVSMQNDLGLGRILLGQPFGTGYTRPSAQGLLEYTPHNWFVVLYLRTGALGLLLWLSIVLPPLTARARARHELSFSGGIAVLTFGMFYHLSLVAALGFSLLALGARAEVDRPPNAGAQRVVMKAPRPRLEAPFQSPSHPEQRHRAPN